MGEEEEIDLGYEFLVAYGADEYNIPVNYADTLTTSGYWPSNDANVVFVGAQTSVNGNPDATNIDKVIQISKVHILARATTEVGQYTLLGFFITNSNYIRLLNDRDEAIKDKTENEQIEIFNNLKIADYLTIINVKVTVIAANLE